MRQAWPFLTFCDNAAKSRRETQTYIGTTYRIGSSPETFADGISFTLLQFSVIDVAVFCPATR